MICEKTGATFYLEEYGCAVRGDAFRLGDNLIIRVTNASRTAEDVPVIHYHVGRTERWWDDQARYGTIVATSFTYHGYEGEAQ